jgi:hypothetical protein
VRPLTQDERDAEDFANNSDPGADLFDTVPDTIDDEEE